MTRMANHLMARVPADVDWVTVSAILERDLGLTATATPAGPYSCHLTFDAARMRLTSALLVFRSGGPDGAITQLMIRDGGEAQSVMRTVLAVTGGRIRLDEDGGDWDDVVRTMPPVDLDPDQEMASSLLRMGSWEVMGPVAALCGDPSFRDGLETVLRVRREATRGYRATDWADVLART